MNWNNDKFKRIYDRQKKQALYTFQKLTEEDLSSNYLDGEAFENEPNRKSELIAYERGILRGIKMIDELLTPVTLDPLEHKETRFQIVTLYGVDENTFGKDLEKLQKQYSNEKILVGYGIEDILLNKEPEKIFFYKEEAEAERSMLLAGK